MRVPIFDLRVTNYELKEQLTMALVRVLDHGKLFMGPEVEEFEELISKYIGVKYAVGVGSGSSALYMALKACGIGLGDEVITTPLTWIITVNAIAACGATPVFADVRNDFNIDPYLMHNSVIKSISWQSRRFNEKVLERVNNYPLLCKHLISSLSSKEDLETHQFHESGCKGIDNNDISNDDVKFNGLVKSARKNICGQKSVVLKLFSGITLSDPIDLDLTQGLTLEIVLANASEICKDAVASAGIGANYIMYNPRLHIPILFHFYLHKQQIKAHS